MESNIKIKNICYLGFNLTGCIILNKCSVLRRSTTSHMKVIALKETQLQKK